MRTTLVNTVTTEPVVSWALVVSGFCLIIQWLLVGFFIWQLPPEIPLWYSLPAGKVQLATREWFLLLPAISLGAFFVNIILTRLGLFMVKVYVPLIMWLTALMLFMVTVAMGHIILMAM
jgi:hypothetical protein